MLTLVPDQSKNQEWLLKNANMLETAIINFLNQLPESRERNLALTNFQQGLMWAGTCVRSCPIEAKKE